MKGGMTDEEQETDHKTKWNQELLCPCRIAGI